MKILQRFKWPIILFLLGLLSNVTGAWFKVMHYQGSDFLLTTGFILQALALAIAVFFVFRYKGDNTNA